MPEESFLLYTAEGERLAQSLVAAVCAEVAADRLTRLSALDHVSDAMERVGEVDRGIEEPDTATAIARRVSVAFRKAGYVPVDGKALTAHYAKWVRAGAPVGKLPLSASVGIAADAARDFAIAAAPLFRRTDITAAVSGFEPWAEGFETDPARDADVALFAWRGDSAGTPHLSAIVMGDGRSVYLEDMPRAPDPVEMLRTKLIGRGDVDYVSLAAQMADLAMSSRRFSKVAGSVRDPARLGIGLNLADDMPGADVRWDGIPVDFRVGSEDCGIPLDEDCWVPEAEPDTETRRPGM